MRLSWTLSCLREWFVSILDHPSICNSQKKCVHFLGKLCFECFPCAKKRENNPWAGLSFPARRMRAKCRLRGRPRPGALWIFWWQTLAEKYWEYLGMIIWSDQNHGFRGLHCYILYFKWKFLRNSDIVIRCRDSLQKTLTAKPRSKSARPHHKVTF